MLPTLQKQPGLLQKSALGFCAAPEFYGCTSETTAAASRPRRLRRSSTSARKPARRPLTQPPHAACREMPIRRFSACLTPLDRHTLLLFRPKALTISSPPASPPPARLGSNTPPRPPP